ncbi:PTS sugar transporter subunit IIA [Limobrevibacterium gyesilva]|uniref:PTS sugar transporter subunit IIA n=1 Tax=Limobrevibacterium gyesilva TaxID=2991712 RepID=A0AA41YH52_9PROT|nr:PTS sugar transporter subunit IIA [Limobrevibacterium gyesilva]MCW3473099.1 PTS sugar transporter subunit IIA [Limobrevibacterium gyesilva]
MTLTELIGPDHVFPRLRAADKQMLLAELGGRAATMLHLPAAAVTSSLAAREALGSTGIGGGIAVPHARIDGIEAPAGFFARLERPIDFAAIDGKPVDLVFLLLSPAQGHGAHLAALAAASRRLRDRTVAEAIRAAGSGPAMRIALLGDA